jgi:hypothetical protein
MAVTQNTYTGNGSTVLFSFTFPYLETADIKVSVNGTNTTAYTLANATTVQFNTAPANGAAIRIYRQTDDSQLSANFYAGSAIRSQDLNDNFTQNLYVTQESNRDATSAIATANSATTTANTALSTANAATTTANTASTNASAAVTTANTASTNASAAVSTANTASSNASTALSTANSAASDAANALSTANTALSTANTASTNATTALNTANSASSAATSAVTTANTASTNASNAVTTANTASTNASTAVTTANTANAKADSAITAISSSAVFTPVVNVAAIPSSPTNGQNIQVTDSTGIESFTPLTGLPVGFVGDSGIAARIQYSSGTWNWFGYFATNSDTRYLKLSGGTLTGQLKADDSTSTTSPVYSFDGDTNTGIAHTGADELALVTGGTARVTIDGSGSVNVPGSISTPALSVTTVAGIEGSLAFIDQTDPQYAVSIAPSTAATANTTYTLPSADGTNGQLLKTNGSGALSWTSPVDISGKLDSSTAASTYAPLASPTFTGTVTIPAGASISGYAPTATPTFTGQPYINGSYRANITAVAALNIDCSLGNFFTKTINGASTFTVSNVPASRSYAFTLELTHTSGTITWFSGVVWPGGTAPTLTTGKVHLFMFFTDDGGTTWRASSLINY